MKKVYEPPELLGSELLAGENISCVTRPYNVTVLPFEITLKFVHLKFQQNING